MWADVRRAAIIARDTGMALRVHRGSVEVVGVLKQPTKPTVTKMEPKQTATPTMTKAVAKPPPAHEDASPPAVSKRKLRSQQRLQEYQQKRQDAQVEQLAKQYQNSLAEDMPVGEGLLRRAKARVKLRSILWRAWWKYRPVYGGVSLGYTSLREQYVYKRASKLYAAAFGLDPSKTCRSLTGWLGRVTPMEQDSPEPAVRSACGAKKTRVS